MALVIYPNTDYDSFISVADATIVITTLTLHGTAWSTLGISAQEIYLRIACRDIESHIDQTVTPYPDPFPLCVGEAQALMAIQDVVYGFSSSTSTAEVGSVKKKKVASLEIEYYDVKTNTTKKARRIPAMAVSCLESLGYISTPVISGLQQTILGRS